MQTEYVPRAEQYLYSLLKENAKKYIGLIHLPVVHPITVIEPSPKKSSLAYINFAYKNLMGSDAKNLKLRGKHVDPAKLSGYIMEMLCELVTYSMYNPMVYRKCKNDWTPVLDNVNYIRVYVRSIIYGNCKCDFCFDAQQLRVFNVNVDGHMRIKHLTELYRRLKKYSFKSHDGKTEKLYPLSDGRELIWFDIAATYENHILVVRINCTNCDSYLIYQPYHIKLP
jgi:hypothetical protein